MKPLAEVRAEISWGMMFHTALRKGVDSTWSALLWQMINNLSTLDDAAAKKDRVWPHFVDWCEKRYRETEEKPSEIVKAYLAASDDYNHPDWRDFPRNSVSVMFKLALELCDDDTWEQLDAYLSYIEKEMMGR